MHIYFMNRVNNKVNTSKYYILIYYPLELQISNIAANYMVEESNTMPI